jgi:uncharacterized protein (TIGR00730 family)
MTQPGRRRYDVRDADLAQRIDDLMATIATRYAVDPESDRAESLRQMLVTVTRLAGDGASAGNVKLLNNALKELRHSFRVFAPYSALRKVACFGSARTAPDHPDWEQARRFAEHVIAEGWMVITGAGGGIMAAAQSGAGREASFGVNIRLPFEQQANEVIAGDEKLINFRYFFTRKVMFVKESHAIVLFPGGFGTHDEGFEALTLIQTGKSEIVPVVFLDAPGGSYWRDWQSYVESHLGARGLIDPSDAALYHVTDDVDDAVRHLLAFYSNYHSSRHVRDALLLRVHRAPDGEQLERLNDAFADLLERGRIELTDPLPAEQDEAPGLARVRLWPHRKKVGRLRELIDELNTLVPESAASPRGALPHEIVAEPVPYEQEVEEDAETGG